MPMDASALFEPFTLKSLRLPNRVVMAPMTRYGSPGGVPGADVARYYERRARGGVGLILSEGTAIDRPAAVYDPAIPGFHGADALAGWEAVIRCVHDAGGRMAPQLWHSGALCDGSRECPWPDALESPSGLSSATEKIGVAMNEGDVADTIAAYARCALHARELGFDCVEIHGAHGYLLDQYFWAATNRRGDRYGGATLPERTRLAAEVVRAVRQSVGEDFVISLRVSQWKQQDYTVKLAATPAELEAWLGPLADAGVDIFHCSQRRFWEPEFDGSDLNLAGWVRKLTGKSTITVGSVGLSNDVMSSFSGEPALPATLGDLVDRLERGDFDLVAVGRALIADPDWVAKVRDGRAAELRGFTPAALQTLA